MKYDLRPWQPGAHVLCLEGGDLYAYAQLPVEKLRAVRLYSDAAIRKAAYSSWRAHIETKR